RRDALRVRPTAVRAGEAGIRETRVRALRAKATRLAPETSCDRQRICPRRKEQAATVRLPAQRRGQWHEPVSGRPAVLSPAPYTETDSAAWRCRARQVLSRWPPSTDASFRPRRRAPAHS